MLSNTNINLAKKEYLNKTEDLFGRFVKIVFLLGLIIFPWLIVPSFPKPMELPREVFLFVFTGIFLILYFAYSLKKGEFEWKRTKLNWILGVLTVALGLIFLYAKNHEIAWGGYPGSFTGGLSEYLAFIAFYFLSVQLFSFSEWKTITRYFLVSLILVLIFFIAATIYFRDNNILLIDFARTPSLVTSSAGIVALAFWWVAKRTEATRKSYSFIAVLALFFISSLFDFYIGWWMWVAGATLILFFELVSKAEIYIRKREERQLGMNNKESDKLLPSFLRGDTKYLILIILFALSRSISPIILKKQILGFMPFSSFLVQYPILGQRVLFYLFLNFIVFCFGLYYFWKTKKKRNSILLVLSGLVSISLAHLLYYSESTIIFLLNWILLVYGGFTFLRKSPERDYLYLMAPKSQGKKVFIVLGIIFSILVLGLIALKVSILWN